MIPNEDQISMNYVKIGLELDYSLPRDDQIQ